MSSPHGESTPLPQSHGRVDVRGERIDRGDDRVDVGKAIGLIVESGNRWSRTRPARRARDVFRGVDDIARAHATGDTVTFAARAGARRARARNFMSLMSRASRRAREGRGGGQTVAERERGEDMCSLFGVSRGDRARRCAASKAFAIEVSQDGASVRLRRGHRARRARRRRGCAARHRRARPCAVYDARHAGVLRASRSFSVRYATLLHCIALCRRVARRGERGARSAAWGASSPERAELRLGLLPLPVHHVRRDERLARVGVDRRAARRAAAAEA